MSQNMVFDLIFYFSMLLMPLVADLEDTTRLALLSRGMNPKLLANPQIQGVILTFNVAWDE